MCTLIAAVRHFPEYPLVVAANRDEFLDRPASPPMLWPGAVQFVAPKDERAGGTWLGFNSAGLFVGVTNRFGVPRDDSRASRGRLVAKALETESAQALHRSLAGLGNKEFNAFHLLYADRSHAFVTWSDGLAVRQQELPTGLHVITERSLGGDDKARTELIRREWSVMERSVGPNAEAMETLLRMHGAEDPLGGTCVHLPSLNYGTRSSCIVRVGPPSEAVRFWWAEGHPCTSVYREESELIRALNPEGWAGPATM